MQGRQILEQPLFSTIDISALVPASHLLRKIDKILDLSFLRDYILSDISKFLMIALKIDIGRVDRLSDGFRVLSS